MDNTHFHVVPAEAGHFVVANLKEKKELAIGAAVIAWRFETGHLNTATDFASRCVPLTMQGDAAANSIGILHPDKKVTLFSGESYHSISEAQSVVHQNTSYGTPDYTA